MNTIKQLEQRVANLEALPASRNAAIEGASQAILQRAAASACLKLRLSRASAVCLASPTLA